MWVEASRRQERGKGLWKVELRIREWKPHDGQDPFLKTRQQAGTATPEAPRTRKRIRHAPRGASFCKSSTKENLESGSRSERKAGTDVNEERAEKI